MRHRFLAALAASVVSLIAPSSLLAISGRVTLVASPNPAAPGEPVNLTASVSVCVDPMGDVEFYDITNGTIPLGSSGIFGHYAYLTVSTLPSGVRRLMAIYYSGYQCDGPAYAYRSETILASVPGYVNPKYIVLGVNYVVPGPQSFSKYCTNTSVGTTDAITNTFTSTYQNSVSTKLGINIQGFLNGSETNTMSSTYTQTSSIMTSVAVSQSSSLCNQIPGPTNPYQGNNHDYDVIMVWVNPVVVLDYLENPDGTIAQIQWNGFGFNERDQPAMEVDQIYAGCLNGDFPTGPGTSCADNLAPLQRSWDTDTTWPSGQGPALNSQDLANVLAADPFGMCTPEAMTPPSSYPADNCAISPDPARFTITDNQDILYQQPVPGIGPSTTQYSLGYVIADTQSQGHTTTNTTTFAVEDQFQSNGFLLAVTETMNTSQTFTTTTQTNQSLATSNGTTMMVSVTGPPCTLSGGSCNPLYPSTAAPGPTQFDVYEDTQYGTFLLYPVNWYY